MSSSMVKSNLSNSSITIFSKLVKFSAPSTTTARSDGVFDVPQCITSRADDVTHRVGAVAKEWRWAMLDPKSLALIIPVDQNPKTISRERFVSLLEYCEEELGVERVLAVFKRPELSMSEGFPRTLRYVGFRVLPPDAAPSPFSSDNFFVMSYHV
ncbi:Ornithine decarboxylase antizyme [Trichostrongylus colubriformis]|uniref:Ornithine decarboxylase antizyme n=1 Tax=Trichostrongylus colubriformis TaxID=6319 RepID=A0AAN8ETE7_TRICO